MNPSFSSYCVSGTKLNKKCSFPVTWMDLEIVIPSGVSQTDKHHIKYHVFPLCGIQKMVHMNLFTKQKQSHRFRKQFFGYQEYEGGGIDWEIGVDIYTLLYVK